MISSQRASKTALHIVCVYAPSPYFNIVEKRGRRGRYSVDHELKRSIFFNPVIWVYSAYSAYIKRNSREILIYVQHFTSVDVVRYRF